MLKPKLKLLFRPGLYLVWGLLCSLKLWSQSICPSEPKFDVPGNVLRIQGIWKDASSIYVENLNIRSVSGGQYMIKIGKLVQAQSRRVVMGKKISVSDSVLLIPANGQQSIEVQASNLSEAGLYEAVLEISAAGTTGTCKWQLPLRLELHRENALKVLEADQNQTYKYVRKSWLDFVMPAALLQRRIQVRIDNEEALPLRLDSFALALKGQGSGEQINQGSLRLRGDQKQVAPKDLKTLSFDLIRIPSAADQYKGQLRLYFKEQSEPLVVNLAVYFRKGAGLALLMLLLGILMGRLIRYMTRVQDQMPLVGAYYRVAARAGRLNDVVARQEMELKLSTFEKELEAASNAETIKAKQNELGKLAQQIEQLIQLEVSIELVRESPELKISSDTSKRAKLNELYLRIRDAVLEFNTEAVKNGLAELQSWVDGMKGDRGGLIDNGENKLQERLIKSAGVIEATPILTKDTPPAFGPWKRTLIAIVGFLSGISINVRSAYLWGRPLVALVTFLVLLLIGYHEMYIKSGDTFGAEGLYDYLKLMLWGALSDGFSQSLVGSKEVLGFLGKEKG